MTHARSIGLWTLGILLTVLTVLAQPRPPTLTMTLGGANEDTVRDVVVGRDGTFYATGGTASDTFPATVGDVSFNGRMDVFVIHFDAAGKTLWSTLLGGPNYDRAYAIEVDAQGFVYVAGRAGAGFPVTPGVFQTIFAGGPVNPRYGSQDGFVCKLTPDGATRVFCTYFGGPDESIVRDLAVGPRGGIFIASAWRQSGVQKGKPGLFANLPPWVNQPKGDVDTVVARLSPDGAKVLWARYLGGARHEGNEAVVRLDEAVDPYVLLTTTSVNIETTGGAADRTLGGTTDVYVAKLDGPSGALRWATYVGGPGIESTETHELAVSPSGIATLAVAQQATASAPPHIFVARLSADGTQITQTLSFGGNGASRSEGIAVDGDQRVYLTGTTTSTNFPLTDDAFDRTLGGGRDAFVTLLGLDASNPMVYSTYLGGPVEEFGRSIAVGSGWILLGGQTEGPWPGTTRLPGSSTGLADGFVTLFRRTP